MKNQDKNQEEKKKKSKLIIILIILLLALLSLGCAIYQNFFKEDTNYYNTIIKEMNTFIKICDEKEPVDTVSDAQDELIHHGFRICALKPADKEYSYGYDIVKKEFVLLKVADNYSICRGYKTDANENVYVFVSDKDELKKANESGFSAYLLIDYADSEVITNKGVDTGEAKITSIKYTNDKAGNFIIICTNLFEMEIKIDDTTNRQIKHYGFSSNAIINSSNYEEHGTVARCETNNSFVLKDDGKIISTSKEKCEEDKHEHCILVVDDENVYMVCEKCGYTIKDSKACDKATAIGVPNNNSKPSKTCSKDHCDMNSYKSLQIGDYYTYTCKECGFAYKTK